MNAPMYLDANAHLPVNNKAIKTYIEFNQTLASHGHPASPSKPGRAACEALENAREKIANLIGAKKANQIIFTSTCTQACEWAAYLLAEANKKPNDRALVSVAEHPAMRDAARKFFTQNVSNLSAKYGLIEIDHLQFFEKAICLQVQNEVGIIYDIKNLKSHCDLLLSDMSQSLGKIPVNVTELGVDIAVFGAHKFGGFGSVGFIYLKDTEMWKPFGTGSRYFMDRAGTMDVASIVASVEALEDAIATLPTRNKNMIEFRDTLEPGLINLGFEIIAQEYNRVPNTTYARVPKSLSLFTMKTLSDHGIHIGLGSACGSLHTGESPLMRHFGINGTINDFVRISQWGEYNKDQAQIILNILNKSF